MPVLMHTHLEVFSSFTHFSIFYSSSKSWVLQKGGRGQFQQTAQIKAVIQYLQGLKSNTNTVIIDEIQSHKGKNYWIRIFQGEYCETA